MIIIKSVQELRNKLEGYLDKRIGFVPTMGSLHGGHSSLIKQAKKDSDCVFVSIFINPYQFNDDHDFQSYPRQLTSDSLLLKELEVDYLFIPDCDELYPIGYDYIIHANNHITSSLEGVARPGHFNGMLTVVMKLLMLVRPTFAYFGEKDYQQALLIEEMAASFFVPTTIIKCPTIRDKSGLPLSSRNKRLTQSDKFLLTRVYKSLIVNNYEDLKALIEIIQSLGVHVEYLQEVSKRIFIAIKISNTRIIDNFLKETGPC